MKGAFDVYFISDFDTELSDVPFQKENWMNVSSEILKMSKGKQRRFWRLSLAAISTDEWISLSSNIDWISTTDESRNSGKASSFSI